MTCRGDNPLWRRSDRIESRCTAALLMLLLTAGPVLAAWAAHAAHRNDTAVREWERGNRFAVDAAVLEDASPAAARPPAPTPPVRCRWMGPDGRDHFGRLTVPVGTRAGSRIAVWVDRAGVPAEPPRRHSPRTEAVTAAVAALLGTGLVVWVARAGVVGMLNRQRMRRWQEEWLAVEPVWSRQR